MHLFIDLLLISLILILSLRFYRTGIFRTLIGVGKFIFAAYLALKYGVIFSNIFNCGTVISYLIAFCIFLLILSAFSAFFERIRVPIVSGIDKAFGFLIGASIGISFAAIIASLAYSSLEFVCDLTGDGSIMSAYEQSRVFKFIYGLDIFSSLRKLIFKTSVISDIGSVLRLTVFDLYFIV